MKKFLALLLALTLAFSLVSCTGEENPEKPVKAEKPSYPRCLDISDGIADDGDSFSYSLDFDYDGTKDSVTMNVTSYDDTGEQYIDLYIGTEDIRMDMWDGSISKVYDCDLDTKDNLRDLAIITEEGSGDPRVRIVSYSDKEGLYLQKFLEDAYYDEESERAVNLDNWMGYACTYYFNVNDDDTLTIEEQTSSAGMWSVYKKYKRNSQGVYEEIRPDKYEILPDFMKGVEEWGEFISEEEKALWKKGYVMARLSYKNENIELSVGELFKPLYDDGNNNLYIEKESGEKGWIDISYENFGDRHDFNPLFFFLAG